MGMNPEQLRAKDALIEGTTTTQNSEDRKLAVLRKQLKELNFGGGFGIKVYSREFIVGVGGAGLDLNPITSGDVTRDILIFFSSIDDSKQQSLSCEEHP